jgi:hypothetical protein
MSSPKQRRDNAHQRLEPNSLPSSIATNIKPLANILEPPTILLAQILEEKQTK